MNRYPVSPRVGKEFSRDFLRALLSESFLEVREEGEFLHASFGALRDLKVGIEPGPSRRAPRLLVETVMDPKVPAEMQAETIRRYNRFLEGATGYTSKERAKKLQAEAKKGAPGA